MKVDRTCDFPPHGFMLALSYADLDAGRLPEGCWFYEQLANGKRYPGRDGKPGTEGTAGGVIVVRLDELDN